jgi:hypothetical protein
VLALLPVDLETSARHWGVWQRTRAVRSAGDLLRLVLVYVQTGWSLRLTAAWALLHGLGAFSHVALRQRLCAAEDWLRYLITVLVDLQGTSCPAAPVRVRLVDATSISRPGSRGTDWRVHVSVDVGQALLAGVEVTDGRGGETLTRHALGPHDVAVADAGYSHPRGLAPLQAAGAAGVVRWAWQTLPLQSPTGAAYDPWPALRRLPTGGVGEWPVQAATPSGSPALRLVALRLPQAAAERARARLRRQARKKGRTPSARSLEQAAYVLLVTTLPAAWDAAAVLALYRLRWQVELVFKRLKSLWQLDGVRARHPALGTVYLLGTLLAALLALRQAGPLPASCAAWWLCPEQPVSAWRWEQLWQEVLRSAVCGALTRAQVLAYLLQLRRYLCDGPRRRAEQAATARYALGPPHAAHRPRPGPTAAPAVAVA